MKQFGKILKFELNGYLRNKMFVGITVFLVVAITLIMFLPNIISAFASNDSGETSSDELPVMLVYAENEELASLVNEYFKNTFTDYSVQTAKGSVEDIKSKLNDFIAKTHSKTCIFLSDILGKRNIMFANKELETCIMGGFDWPKETIKNDFALPRAFYDSCTLQKSKLVGYCGLIYLQNPRQIGYTKLADCERR